MTCSTRNRIRHIGLVALASLALATNACSSGSGSDDGDPGSGDTTPEGPVATNVDEAWPDRGEPAAVLERQQLVDACVTMAECSDETPANMGALVALCVHSMTWAGERAIPLGDPFFEESNERVEFAVGCVLDASSCSAVDACITKRELPFRCEEDGCTARGEPVDITCDGNTAVAMVDGKEVRRDCARALGTCDAQSATGCTDRTFTACPEGAPHVDRCEGSVRLGCDRAHQVSFRDCSRMGGNCSVADTKGECSYTDVPDPECVPGSEETVSCDGGQLELCVLGRRVSSEAPAICAATE